MRKIERIIIHRSINDSFLITGRGYNYIAISYSPLMLLTTVESNNIIKWDEDSQEETIDSWFPTGASVSIGNLRIGSNIVYNGVSKRAYSLPLAANAIPLDSINDTYGVASLKIGSVMQLLIV